MPVVFLSYRRDDSRDVTGRLFDRLTDALGAEHVFRDVDSIPFGVDFRRVLREEVDCCDVFVAVVGPSWLTLTDAAGRRRLDDPDDFVRLEVEAALQRGVPVFVALARGAERPTADRLPPTLAALADRPALPLRPDPDFGGDVAALVRVLRKAPRGPSRPLRAGERWVETRRTAAWGAALGALAGGLTGTAAAAMTVDPRPEQAMAVGLLLAVVGGTVAGWRGLGLLGSLGGCVLGLMSGVLFLIAVMFGSVFLVMLAFWAVGRNPGGMGGWREQAIIACGFAAAGAALVAGPGAFAWSRRRPLWTGSAGALVGAALGAGVAYAAIWAGMQRNEWNDWAPPAWLQANVLSTALAAAVAAAVGALLGAQSGWRRRKR